jgi:hypothetical protein
LGRWAIVAAIACLVVAPVARADGDPASDYLLGLSAFVPPDAGVPSADAQQLTAVVKAAKARGYGIRVALIATRYDMGSVTPLFQQPRHYARFLGQELYFVYKGRLLVAMPNGYGVSRGGKLIPAAQAMVDGLPPPGADGHQLATRAIVAVRRLAAASGIAVPLPKPVPPKSQTGDRLVIAVAGIVVLLALAGGMAWRRRTQ